MTQIVNLPDLETLTNSLVFPAADTGDANRTKKVTLAQLVALSAGPRGPAGTPGIPGPIGPSGPSGPNANQSLNTESNVTFQSVQITNVSTGLKFPDNTTQITAFKKSARNLTEFVTGNAILNSTQLVDPIITADPTVSGRELYLPTANTSLAGIVLIIRNRSNSYTFNVWGGLANIATVATNSTVQVACDGFTWFVV